MNEMFLPFKDFMEELDPYLSLLIYKYFVVKSVVPAELGDKVIFVTFLIFLFKLILQVYFKALRYYYGHPKTKNICI